METMQRSNTKVIVTPVTHTSYSGNRRTWTASIVLRSDDSTYGNPDARIKCGHENHPTSDAAAKCGVAQWRKLP